MIEKWLITGGSGFIGTNLVENLIKNNMINFINIDKNNPPVKSHRKYWKECNILDEITLNMYFKDFSPTHVLHLAARTDTDCNSIEDYKDNTIGTVNVLNAIKNTPSITRAIFTSTQYVYRPGNKVPKHDEDYDPHTTYGESKVLNEIAIRQFDTRCVWTIIRPTNIWGPWHLRYRDEFLKIMFQGRYLHPGSHPVIRSYGYVGNVVHQIYKILHAPEKLVHRQVYYVGDPPLRLIDWVNSFSQKVHGKNVRIIPRIFVRGIALLGDFFKLIGITFPITTSRYVSMTQDYLTPMDKTIDNFGPSLFSLEAGVSETINWLKSNESIDFKNNN